MRPRRRVKLWQRAAESGENRTMNQSETGSTTTVSTRSINASTWLAASLFLLALVVAVSLFWFAYDKKRRASMKAEASSEEPRQYFKVAIGDMPSNHYTHVEITGKVQSTNPEKDGDTHIQVSDGTDFVIAECIPKLPCSVIPDVGQTVVIRGISRYDRENHWYEVHPVEEIEIKK